MNNNELYHHGIKGQQWGVRNGPPYPLKISRRQAIKMNKQGYRLKKGTEMYRVSGTEKEKNTGEAFASFSKHDKQIYSKRLMVNMSNPKAVAFNMTMKLTEDLVVPSQKERVDSFIKYYSEPKNSEKIMKMVRDSGAFKESDVKRILDKKDYNAYLNFCLLTSGINRTSATNFKNGNELLKQKDEIVGAYHDILKKKGYNATVDDLDAVNTVMGNNPVIIFDRGKTVEIINVSKIKR